MVSEKKVSTADHTKFIIIYSTKILAISLDHEAVKNRNKSNRKDLGYAA